MPTNAIDSLLADAVTGAAHPAVAEVITDPSGRPDAWTRLTVKFADGSACYISAETVR
ncbi:hypothetical protein [Mycolicibacter virginiensis]|uniref:hypothetical protein n=1 Tax=Mycolicibacter virginiensis TaxID=1795032 RepID=UPI001F042162|nr:hypothetical protein [Mycolicibacter virginiensis]ULP45916.1 hypothetical protein MJO54_13655 [Mycolicibacter virginiensis]